METKTFIHNDEASTLSEIKRIHDWVETKQFFGIFAYATISGASLFDLMLGDDFWRKTHSKWLFGIDYGRTQPHALRYILEKDNTEVRIVDGAWVIEQDGFIPRRDFHAKASLLLNPNESKHGMVVGSGNFSSNGLIKSIEAGAVIQVKKEKDFNNILHSTLDIADSLWEDSTEVENLIDLYEEKWDESISRKVPDIDQLDQNSQDFSNSFWIEVGYVTKNRGIDRPGNQIDLPRGMCRYFGFNPPDDLPPNSLIGEVVFRTPSGDDIPRNLRLGNNLMEKITLPIPETYGFNIYDGKVLVFNPVDNAFIINALEADDFETAFGNRVSGVRVMGSGRRFGQII